MHDLETFSQDVKLNYLIHKKIPTSDELENLYQSIQNNSKK